MKNNNEEWLPVEGFDNVYWVSNHGQVKSFTALRDGKILKPILNNKGYYQVCLKGRKYLINRLVASAFIPNPYNKPNINHKDTNPKNNCVENLEWCTQKENIDYSLDFGNFKKLIGSGSPKSIIDENVAVAVVHLSSLFTIDHVAKLLNIKRSMVHSILTGRTWSRITNVAK